MYPCPSFQQGTAPASSLPLYPQEERSGLEEAIKELRTELAAQQRQAAAAVSAAGAAAVELGQQCEQRAAQAASLNSRMQASGVRVIVMGPPLTICRWWGRAQRSARTYITARLMANNTSLRVCRA